MTQADLYPHFSLTGIGGIESLSFASVAHPSSGYYSLGPSLSWNIFNAGKINFKVLAERARTDAAAADYQQAVLNALRDAETALVSYGKLRIRHDALTAEVTADRDAVTIATRLYRQGISDFLAVLDAERSLYAAEDKLAINDRDTALALISLYKSLGGGWQAPAP